MIEDVWQVQGVELTMHLHPLYVLFSAETIFVAHQCYVVAERQVCAWSGLGHSVVWSNHQGGTGQRAATG